MKWRRPLVVWLILMTPLTVYNLLPIVSSPTIPRSTFQDPKVLTYNFTMDKPSFAQDNFTAHVVLDENPSFYNIRAYAYNVINLNSGSALGEYDYNYSIYINGAKVLTGSYGAAWAAPNTQFSAQGPAPNTGTNENITNLHAGVNMVEFRFVQFSRLYQYDTGYYNLKLGPFSVDLSGKPVSMIGPLTLEIILAVILIPVSFLLSFASYRIKRMGRMRLLRDLEAIGWNTVIIQA